MPHRNIHRSQVLITSKKRADEGIRGSSVSNEFDPQNPHKKPGLVAPACNPSTEDMEIGRSLGLIC